MKLLFLSESNLRDRLFVKDLVHHFKMEEKAILLHETFGETVRDTRFVTKRLSALLSEAMVYNNAFSADQRGLMKENGDGLMEINQALIESLMPTIQVLLIGPVIKKNQKAVLADPFKMAQALRTSLDISEISLFTSNPLSPLATKKPMIDTAEDAEKWLKAYDEERVCIENALRLRPARIYSPTNFSS